MPDFISVFHLKSSGRVLGVMRRAGSADGAGDAALIAAPGIAVRLGDAHMVTVPATELALLPVDAATYPLLLRSPLQFEIVDNQPAVANSNPSSSVSPTAVNFANAAPPAGKKVSLYLQIEGGALTEPLVAKYEATAASFSVARPALAAGTYRFLIATPGSALKLLNVNVP